jgi:hypothetical protein
MFVMPVATTTLCVAPSRTSAQSSESSPALPGNHSVP